MTQIVTGLFDDRRDAEAARDELIAAGIQHRIIDMITNDPAQTNMLSSLSESIPEPDVRFYMEGVRRGGTLLVIRAPDNSAQQVADILSRHNIVDVDARLSQYRTAGSDVRLRDYQEGDITLPVIEEQLQIGKRQVERGRLRVYSHVSERPVEEQVNLREETVRVERRPVDRAVSNVDEAAFKEGTYEFTETVEEAVVNKQARVIEEVVIGKDVQERTETIRDTVRRTDVEVDQSGKERQIGASTTDFSSFDNDFRTYYQKNLSSSGYTYDQYSPVFRYGYDLASDDRYGGNWTTVEPEARRYWEERNPGTWAQFKDSIRYAWDRARGRR